MLISAKYQRNSFFMKGSEFSHDQVLDKTYRLDKIEFDRKIDSAILFREGLF